MCRLVLPAGETIVKKNWLWIAPLLLLSLPASADWTYVDGGDGYERYLDLDSVSHEGRRVRVWEVDDNEQPDRSGVTSLRSRTEYDCMTRMYRITHLSGHSSHMTQGQVVFSEAFDGDWEPVAPGTLGEASMHIVCNAGELQDELYSEQGETFSAR
jgi:hypothetical protein